MADAQDGLSPVEAFDAAGWRKQALQFKRELDQVNPRLNAAEQQIGQLEKALADARALCGKTDEQLQAALGELRLRNEDIADAGKRLAIEVEAHDKTKAAAETQLADARTANRQLTEALTRQNSANARLVRSLQQAAKRAGEIVADVTGAVAGAE